MKNESQYEQGTGRLYNKNVSTHITVHA